MVPDFANLDGVADGLCSANGRPGHEFTWEVARWTRGTSPSGREYDFECSKLHVTHSSQETSPLICGTCGEIHPRRRGGRMWGANCEKWPWDTIIPRTCSYCGGVNIEDALKLIDAGFKLAATDKLYKAYMIAPDGTEPLPPAKFYTYHMTDEQRQTFLAMQDSYWSTQ